MQVDRSNMRSHGCKRHLSSLHIWCNSEWDIPGNKCTCITLSVQTQTFNNQSLHLLSQSFMCTSERGYSEAQTGEKLRMQSCSNIQAIKILMNKERKTIPERISLSLPPSFPWVGFLFLTGLFLFPSANQRCVMPCLSKKRAELKEGVGGDLELMSFIYWTCLFCRWPI